MTVTVNNSINNSIEYDYAYLLGALHGYRRYMSMKEYNELKLKIENKEIASAKAQLNEILEQHHIDF